MRLPALVLAAAIALALGACTRTSTDFQGTAFEGGPVEEFTLTDQHGETFRLADHRDKVVLLFFGYAHCPDVCPVTLSVWSRVERALGRRDDVEFVFVTVDPERDTAERLREHLEIFSDGFYGLTGSEDEIIPVYESFGIQRRKVPLSSSALGYVMDHSSSMLLLDRKGRLRFSFPFDADAKQVVTTVKNLLRDE